jgi:hypothetical protein
MTRGERQLAPAGDGKSAGGRGGGKGGLAWTWGRPTAWSVHFVPLTCGA